MAFDYEPNIRKEWLISLLNRLANPDISLDALKELTQDEAVPYVWRWQDDQEGHIMKEKTEITEPLKLATANLTQLLANIIERNGLPQVTKPNQQFPPEAVPERAQSSKEETTPSTTNGETRHEDDSSASVDAAVSDSNAADSNGRAAPSSTTLGKSSAGSDTDMIIADKFCQLPEHDAQFCSAALDFLFHAADGSGGAMFNLADAVDFTKLGRVTCSLLYTKNLKTSTNAARVLGQVVGASRYHPPTSVPHLLLSMALNVPCHNGSSVKANSISLTNFISGNFRPEDIRAMLGKDEGELTTNAPLAAAKERLELSFNDREQREMLVAQQSYSLATLMILLGEHGFDKVVTVRAPNALVALVDVCRETQEDRVSVFVKSSIVESLTIFLSFMGSAHNLRLFKRLQLAPLLSEFHKSQINERYFYQLCDLASFAPSQTITYPLKMIQLSIKPEFTSEAKLRALDVLARTFDPPMYNNGVVSDQILESVFAELHKSLEYDLDQILLHTNAPTSNEIIAPVFRSRHHQLVTERLEVMNLFIIPLSWTNIERTVLKTPFVDRMVSILSDPTLFESLPTRAVSLAADTLARICETDQGRVLLLNEQGLKYKLYDAIVLLSRAQNRPLDLIKVVEVLYICLWGVNGPRDEEHEEVIREEIEINELDDDDDEDEENDSENGGANGVIRPGDATESRDASESRDTAEPSPSPSAVGNGENNGEVENDLSDLDMALMSMATNVIVHSFCLHMEKALTKYSPRAAKDVVSSLTTIVRNTSLSKFNILQWVLSLVTTYLDLLKKHGEQSMSFTLDAVIRPLYNTELLNTEVGERLLRYVIFSEGHRLITIFARPRVSEIPEFTDDILRLCTELAIDGRPIHFIRLLHYANLLDSDQLKFVTSVVSEDLLAHFIVDFVHSINQWTQSDHEDFSFVTQMIEPEVFTEIFRKIMVVVRDIPAVPNSEAEVQRDVVTKKQNILQILVEVFSSPCSQTLIAEGVEFTLDMLKVAFQVNESESIRECIQDLAGSVLKPENLGATNDLETFTNLKSQISDKLGFESLSAFNGLYTALEKQQILIRQMEKDHLKAAMKVSANLALRSIGDLGPSAISENASLYLAVLNTAVEQACTAFSHGAENKYGVQAEYIEHNAADQRQQKQQQQNLDDIRDHWLDLVTTMVIQLSAHPLFDASQEFNNVLSDILETLMLAVADQKLLMPQAFSTLHTVLLNLLSVETMVELRKSGSLKDMGSLLQHLPSAVCGTPRKLPEAATMKRLIDAAKISMMLFAEEAEKDLEDDLLSAYEFGISGLAYTIQMIVQSSTELATYAVESGLIQQGFEFMANGPANLHEVMGESLLAICHSVAVSNAVMAGILISQLNNGVAPHELDPSSMAAVVPSIPLAILLRRPSLAKIVEDSFGLDQANHLVPWSKIVLTAKRAKVNFGRPKSYELSNYSKLAESQQIALLKLLLGMLLDAAAPQQAELSAKILIDLIATIGKTRLLIHNIDPEFVVRVLLQFGVQKLPQTPRVDSKAYASNVVPLIVPLLGSLTRRSKTDDFSKRTRKTLEKTTRGVLKCVLKLLTREIPQRISTSRSQAVALLSMCTDLLQYIWGDSNRLLQDLPFITQSYGIKYGQESFYHTVFKELKVVETWTSTMTLFSFSWAELSGLKLSSLLFIDRLVFQELFKTDLEFKPIISSPQEEAEAGGGDGSNGGAGDTQGGQSGSDDALDSVELDDSEHEGDSDEDLMETELAEERRLQHQQRIESSQGSTFRNSSLGEFESSSDDSLESDDEDDEDDVEDEDPDDQSGDAMDVEDHPDIHEDISGDDSGHEPQLEIMLVMSDDDDDDEEGGGDDIDDDEDLPSFETDTSYSSQTGDDEIDEVSESSDDFESFASEDDGESGDDDNNSVDIVDENEHPMHNYEFSLDGFDGDHPGIPPFELNDEVLLMYNDRGQDDGVTLGRNPPRRTNYFRSSFELTGEALENWMGLAREKYQSLLPINENSGLLWDYPQLSADLEREIRSLVSVDNFARSAIEARRKRGDDTFEKMLEKADLIPLARYVPRNDDGTRSKFYPQLLAQFARVCFTDGFDVDQDLIQHAILALAGTSMVRQFFKTMFHILLEASNGHIDSIYASLTRIAASGGTLSPESSISLKPPAYTTPALVCFNILGLLNYFFSADIIVNSSRFLSYPNSKELCTYDDCESHFMQMISSTAKRYLKKNGGSIFNLISHPVVAGNKKLLELASSCLDKIVTASGDNWDPTAPSDLSDDGNSDKSSKAGEGIVHLHVDERMAFRIIEVLSSKECNYKVFKNIVGIVKKHTNSMDLSDPLVKELKRAKHNFHIGVRRLFDGGQGGGITTTATPTTTSSTASATIMGSADVREILEAQLQFLRLLNVAGSLFKREQCLAIFNKVDLLTLWNRVVRVIEVVQQMEGLLPEFMLSLIELVTMPADIIYREHDALLEDKSAEAKKSVETYSGFMEDVTSSLQACMPKYSNLINELIRVKPNLLGGPLGSMALRFKVVDFKNKCDWLNQEIWYYRNEKYADKRHTCVISRDNVFDDSYDLLMGLRGSELLHPMGIEFENEPGVDEGGVAREWYEILSRKILDPMYGLFRPTSPGSSIYQIDPRVEGNAETQEVFRFVGRVIGRAVYDQFTVGLYFSRVVYKFFLGEPISLADMESFDESYYKSLRWMLDNDITDVFYETFSVEVDKFGKTETVDLIPDGRNISVDESNKQDYVQRIVEYKLVSSVKGALEAMKTGLFDVLLDGWVKTFTDQELELLICGLPTIDINDWYANTEYEGYNADSKQIKWFWLAVKSFNPELRAKLLQFSTGTSRVPAQGFGHLESNTDSGKFFIQMEKGSTDRLPSAHTCMNQLCLPKYENYGKLRRLLLKAITEGSEGFGFV